MTVEARELYSSSMGPIVSGSRTLCVPKTRFCNSGDATRRAAHTT
jgi:hypothetical protein